MLFNANAVRGYFLRRRGYFLFVWVQFSINFILFFNLLAYY